MPASHIECSHIVLTHGGFADTPQTRARTNAGLGCGTDDGPARHQIRVFLGHAPAEIFPEPELIRRGECRPLKTPYIG